MARRNRHKASQAQVPAETPPRQFRWLGLALIFAVLFTYGPVLRHDFVYWDDDGHVIENPHLDPVSPASLVRFWSEPYFSLYIPLSYTLITAEAWLAQSSRNESGALEFHPEVFHAGSLVLHIACVLLTFALITRLVGDPVSAAVGAGIFALHPFQVESVAWISEQRGLLAALLSLLSIRAWLQFGHGLPQHDSRNYDYQAHVIQKAQGGWAWYALATLAYVLALLSKPSAAAVPLIAAALDRFLLRRAWTTSMLTLIPWLITAAGMVAITKVQQPDEALSFHAPLWSRPLIAGDALQFYITRLIWPAEFAVQYPRSPQMVLSGNWIYFAWLVPAAVAILCYRYRGQGPWLACFAWFVATLAPVLGLLHFVYQHYSTVADRYMYLAMFAPGWAAAWCLSRSRGRALRWISVSALVVLGILSFQQALVWENTQTLFAHTLRVNPLSDAAYLGLGADALREEKYEQALELINEGIRLNPHTGEEKAYLNRGLALLRLGRIDEAIAAYEQTLRQFPSAYPAHLNLSAAYFQKQDWPRTIEHARAGLKREPNNVAARFNLALALDRQGNTPEAIQELRVLLSYWPRQFAAHMKLASLLHQQGDYDEAVKHYSAGVAEAPQDRTARFDLARALADADQIQASLREFQTLLQQPTADWPIVAAHAAWLQVTRGPHAPEATSQALDLAEEASRRSNFQHPLPLRALAAVAAAQGNFRTAVETAQKAKRLAASAGNASLSAAIETDLAKYDQHEPLRGIQSLESKDF